MSNIADIEHVLSIEKALSMESEQSVPFPTHNPTRKRLLALVAILAMMGLALGLGIGLGSNRSKESESSTGRSETNLGDSSTTVLEEPTSDVIEICNPEYLISGEITCEEVCEPAACCQWTDEDGCREGNEDTCDMWIDAGCFLLGINAQAPLEEPTSDVIEICNPEDLNNGEITCEEACDPAACCQWTDEYGCREGNEDTCDMWIDAGCFLLGINAQAPLEEPTSDVIEICNPEDLNYGEITCEEVCEPAACCQWTDEYGCREGNEDTCDEWIAAGCFLLGINAQEPLDSAPSNLTEICTFSFASNDLGLSECSDLCEPASCCFDFYDGCAFGDNASVCEEYAPCTVVFSATGGDLSDPPSGMLDICNEDLVLCEEMCVAAACCELSGEDSCLDGNLETCEAWALAGCSLVAR